MKHGFIKVAAVTPDVRVADCEFNKAKIIEAMKECAAKQVKIAVFPELCLTGYTCGDLFLQDVLLREAKEALNDIVEAGKELNMLVLVGLPLMHHGNLYNVAAASFGGRLLGIIPKKNIPSYAEFYEGRHFSQGLEGYDLFSWLQSGGELVTVPFGTNILLECVGMPELKIAVEICEDIWVPEPPSIRHALAGATVICNLSASNETTGKEGYRRELVKGQSARLICGYVYATAGEGESTTDLVFGGQSMIAENGSILAEAKRFSNGMVISELDINKLANERRRMTGFEGSFGENYYLAAFPWELPKDGQIPALPEINLTRSFERLPFVPGVKVDRDKRCEEITSIQAMGLKKRLAHTGCKGAVIGVSGGLDSTLALLVTCKAFDLLGLPREQILAVTMPCFGTTDRTYQNAVDLAKELHVTLREIPVREAVTQHFKDIGQDMDCHDVTYENGQARERTQVLMDLANQTGGLVIGTGDMSELALGWATYNGDHMSMYGVNCSVPKTLVRYLVLYFAETAESPELADVLFDVLDTPVSPELLPPEHGEIAQKTEDIVGPYELHDFFLYYVMRYGFEPGKIYRLACLAFAGEYEKETIYRWLVSFYKRFFAQQYKRSCIPDGPKVGSVALSPRGDWRMPSDASVHIWLKELEKIGDISL